MQHIPFSYSQPYCSYTGACQLTGMVNSIMGWEASSGRVLVTDWTLKGLRRGYMHAVWLLYMANMWHAVLLLYMANM